MNEYHATVRKTVSRTMYIAVFWAILWIVLPGGKAIFSALAIGAAVSVYFAVSVARQTEMAAAVAVRKEKKKPITAMVSRIAIVALAVMIQAELGYPNVLLMILSFFTYQGVILADLLINRGKKLGRW